MLLCLLINHPQGRCEDKLNDPALAPWDLLEAGSAALNALEELCGLRIGGLGDSVAEQAYHVGKIVFKRYYVRVKIKRQYRVDFTTCIF